MIRVARAIVGVVASLFVLAAATGWLYLLRPHVPGAHPMVHDALALDELSHHGSVSLFLYAGTWSVAALCLGLVARSLHVERLTAGLMLAVGVGGWLYALNGVSILVVRQIPAHQAFHDAASEQALVIPAVLAGIVGALVGRSRAPGAPRSRLAFAWLVRSVALLAIIDAVLPEHRHSLVTALDPAHVHGLAKALVAPIAAGLALTARGLARGSRRAWLLAISLLALLFVLHVERRFDEGAIVTGAVVVGLVGRRSDFSRRGDPSSRTLVFVHAPLGVAATLAYGLITLWINRLMADQPYTLGFALRIVGRALAGMSFRGADHLSGPLADWFPVSVFLIGWGTIALLVVEWTGPWRYRLKHESLERERAHELVTRYGADTIAPFALRADKSYFFSESGSAFLAYRVTGGVAIVAGDPIGPKEELPALVGRFLEFAHERSWRVAVLGVSEQSLELYRRLGLHALYHGDEAVVDTAAFSLEGRAIRKVRQSVHRLEAAGYTVRILRPSEIDDRLRERLEEIARLWRGKAPERGFVMALDALFGLGDDDAVFVVGFDDAGTAVGFLHYAVSHAGSALSLSTMPRLRTVPNGFAEWLIVESIAWAREHDVARVSLNFSPFAALLAPEGELTLLQRLQAGTLRRLKSRFQLDNLLRFNRKFFPQWQRRFVVYERRRDLPRVGVAALAAEAYLPFQ